VSDIKNRYKLLVIAKTLEMLSDDAEENKFNISEEIKNDMAKIVSLLRSCNKLVNICSDIISKNIDDESFKNKFEIEKDFILKIFS
jgi:hypothetical protein